MWFLSVFWLSLLNVLLRVCCMSSRTHTFLYVCCELPCPVGPWTLTQCPVCELAISPGPDSWGAGVSLPARADSCSFPSSCPLTVEPCAASTSPECQHSCNYFVLTSQALCIFFFFFFTLLPVRSLALFLPEDRHVYLSHIFTSPFVYVSHRLHFLQERWLVYERHRCRVTASVYSKHHATDMSHNSSPFTLLASETAGFHSEFHQLTAAIILLQRMTGNYLELHSQLLWIFNLIGLLKRP